jgi:hypothetical protein
MLRVGLFANARADALLREQGAALARAGFVHAESTRHCEERSDETIQSLAPNWIASLCSQ